MAAHPHTIKHIVLMRHAEAVPEGSVPRDRERSLTQDGILQCEHRRAQLKDDLKELPLLLCSNAKRTRQTLDGIRSIIPSTAEIYFEDQLYNLSLNGLIERIQALPKNIHFAMILGHNPTMQEMLSLAQWRGTEPLAQTNRSFQPSSVAILEASFATWPEASPQQFVVKKLFNKNPPPCLSRDYDSNW